MICCYHTEAKGQMCKEIIPIFLCIALLLSFTLPEIGDYTIRELVYGVQDTITVVRGTHIACEIIAVSNPGYVVYTIYGHTQHPCSSNYSLGMHISTWPGKVCKNTDDENFLFIHV